MLMEEKVRQRGPSQSPQQSPSHERYRFEGMTRSKPLPKF